MIFVQDPVTYWSNNKAKAFKSSDCNGFLFSTFLEQSNGENKKYNTNEFQFAFNIIYAAIGVSASTAIIIGLICFTIYRNCRYFEFELFLYSILIVIWIPFTVCFRWMVFSKWNETYIIFYYEKPYNLIIAAESSFCFICFLMIDTLMFFMSNIGILCTKKQVENNYLKILSKPAKSSGRMFYGRNRPISV